MKNRDSAHPGRIKLTPVDEANGIYDLTRADEPREVGTPLNKKLLDYAVAACGVTAGTATAYTLDDEFGGFELVDGAKVNFRLHVASGVNPTLNVNGTGAKPIISALGDAMPNGIPAGIWITVAYSSLFDAFVMTGNAVHVAAGSYVGDGTGKLDFSLRAYGAELRGVSITSSTPREIELPFAPNVLVIYSPGTPPTDPIYQGGNVTASLYGLIYAATSASGGTSQYFDTLDYSANSSFTFPVVILDGNKLQIFGVASAVVAQQSPSHGGTTASKLTFANISDNVISELGGANVAGVTYNYIAF